MTDILYAPNRERVVTTNAWAFLHWLRVARGLDLPDWAALQRWSASDQAAFGGAIAAFAGLPDQPLGLARHSGEREALVLRRHGERIALTWDQLRFPLPVPAEIAAPLGRFWSPGQLIRPLTEILLHADVRPGNRLLVTSSPSWPWLAALLEGATVIFANTSPATLLKTAGEEQASVVVASAQALAEAAFQRARRRPDLTNLRTIIATGGPLSPEGRTRVYTWIKPDLMLLGRSGDTLWGNPLEPVYARPAATPGFFGGASSA